MKILQGEHGRFKSDNAGCEAVVHLTRLPLAAASSACRASAAGLRGPPLPPLGKDLGIHRLQYGYRPYPRPRHSVAFNAPIRNAALNIFVLFPARAVAPRAGNFTAMTDRCHQLDEGLVQLHSHRSDTVIPKASVELKERIYRRTEELAGRKFLDRLGPMFVGTIHSWCFHMLQDSVPHFGNHEVIDEHRHAAFLSHETRALNSVGRSLIPFFLAAGFLEQQRAFPSQ